MEQICRKSICLEPPTRTHSGRLTAPPIICGVLIMITSLLLAGCGGGGGGTDDPGAAGYVSPLALSLAWNPVPDPSVTGYVIHYGTTSPNSPGSCNYENAVSVTNTGAEGTIINLHPETRYYIAVSAFNGVESACSSEVSTVTPPLPTST